jgi:DNA polymerase I-like protein with 3'-5' exonuclease and polymerase domains
MFRSSSRSTTSWFSKPPTEDAAEAAALVCEEMERAVALRVPLKAEAGIGPDCVSAK